MTRRAERDNLEPARLLDEHATPDALRDALQALRDRSPTPASAARMREQIARPVAPAPPASGTLLSFTLLALVGALAWSVWPMGKPAHEPAYEPARAPRSMAPSEAPSPMALPAAPQATKNAARPHEPIAQPEPAAPQLQAPVAAPLPAPQASPAPNVVRTPLAPKSSTAIKAVDPAPVAASELTAKPEPKTKPLTQREEVERLYADPQDEAGLLYRARRLASRDPKAALRLLVLHEASFPDGAFVQERDMLEIQIHERLGQAATAKRLAALFKQRYPDSVYRVSP